MTFLTGNDHEKLSPLKEKLATEVEIKDLGVLKNFLGMEFAMSKECMSPNNVCSSLVK